MSRAHIVLTLALALSACDEGTQLSPFDAGADFALAPQVTHIGVTATTCCMVTNQGNKNVLYLANPKPSMVNARGIEQPARGELHIADPYGVDFVLATEVPANGYDFAPNGRYALFTKLIAPNADEYSLNFATLTAPELKKPNVSTPIALGMFSRPLNQQAFVTPTGRFLVVGARNALMDRTPDLHVVDLTSGKDIFALTDGAFAYIEIMGSNDVMFYQNAVGSRTPGTPTVQGLYAVSLDAAIYSKVEPKLIDIHTAYASLHADDHSLIYTRTSGELMLFDMRDQTKVKLADNVASFTLGPARRGPLAYITNDRALHVRPILNEETVTTAPGTIDVLAAIEFSPDAQHLYFFQGYREQDGLGDLWHLGLPPSGTGVPTLVSPRTSRRAMIFERDRMLLAINAGDTGETADLVTAALDGSNQKPLAYGVAVQAITQARPQPAAPPPLEGINYGPIDMAPPFVPTVLAHLTQSVIDFNHEVADRPIDETRPILGTLALSRTIDGPMLPLGQSVPINRYRFSDDGYLLFYSADAAWSSAVRNFAGTLRVQSSTGESITPPAQLTGVTELGPIVDRSLYINAPAQLGDKAGVYFLKY